MVRYSGEQFKELGMSTMYGEEAYRVLVGNSKERDCFEN